MKVNLELDLTPEELRRLFGLPDVAPINDMVVEKLGEQVEKGLDGTLVRNLAQTMIKGGAQGFEAYQSFLGAMFRMSRKSDVDAPSAPPRQQRPAAEQPQPPASGTSGANTGGGTT
ncbi:MAG: DUF6489 family protein [Pseudomonadales bacterium]|jgi:hypothetical protein|nr:DUF6489 family protein [Pseudomonadales bacterium]